MPKQDFADIHVTPLGDLQPHCDSRYCWCKPQVEQEPGQSAVVVHQSADGRELVERHGVN